MSSGVWSTHDPHCECILTCIRLFCKLTLLTDTCMQNQTPPTPFPTVRWGNHFATFLPHIATPLDVPVEAVVVFIGCGEGFVLGDIPERGWCVPSGRLEAGETPEMAARRETREEIGAEPENLRTIGYYILTNEERHYVPAFVGKVHSYGNIPPGSESRGARCFRREELPHIYWRWDPLLERMFEYAEQELRR
jgi:8-oxo-dGTP diphosphatase